ncbi:hypothetical protein [Streptomyces xanthophaeus]|uniref:hypothetical protein n=1 Tax=Streptomyces xanthophaeus TaxID=67385 RepID=UPI002647325E|nr:hypothetical protein [Streptomyces xanthophaeus]WKD36545.1 hypothetical protein KO717_34500 [Streptomyces xanthophaeus]
MTTPHTAPETNPLPRLGYCPGCSEEIRLRTDGTLYQHPGLGRPRCPAGRRPAALLEPTFVRWLHANAPRRDVYTNRVTHLAQHMFRSCTQSPNRTPADVPWTTAEELHKHLHRMQLRRCGYEERGGIGGDYHDWVCRDVEQAGRVYAELLAAAAGRAA